MRECQIIEGDGSDMNDDSATAGGIFTFPLISESADIGKFRLTQPQISSIVLALVELSYFARHLLIIATCLLSTAE